MEAIQLWALDGSKSLQRVDEVAELDYERTLEDVIARHPELLMQDLTLIGRQTATTTGWLDLVGIDGDGRLVVFELKRGKLSRDAVTQVVDYASFLAEFDDDALSRHISERSKSDGIEPIPDLQEWYDEKFPGQSLSSALPPRMVLVGLGVDEDTERMTKFLSDAGVDISLVTFHGFKHDGNILLARQARIQSQDVRGDKGVALTINERETVLKEFAKTRNVFERFESLRSFFRERLGSAIENPGKTSLGFYLPARSDSGKPASRVVISIYIEVPRPGDIEILFHKRIVDMMDREGVELQSRLTAAESKPHGLSLPVISDEKWSELQEELIPVISDLVDVWRKGTLG